jgi:hypothetical protein
MKKIILLNSIVFFLVIFYSCSSSETAVYDAGNNENWKIDVIHETTVTDRFKVVINDSIVIKKNVNVITSSLEEISKYRDREIKLIVTFTKGLYGAGGEFEALVYIENKLAAKFKF